MLTLNDVSKQFDESPVLQDITLSVETGEIMCLLGPSGCGKTTLLRVIAGLETADTGDIKLNGDTITRMAVHQRGFGLMFQDFALFPHMNVAQNVAFGLDLQHIPKKEKAARVAEVLKLVGLADFAERTVTDLSGGEQQRVALARSLAPRPRLLMLDEPLGSLDADLRERLVIELREILKAAGVTAIYVTHDQQEAFAIADRVAVMHAGRIEQIDTPNQLFLCPQTRVVASFLGLRNIVRVEQIEDHVAETALGNFEIGAPAEHILLHPAFLEWPSDDPCLSLQVERCVFRGHFAQLTLRHDSGQIITMRIPSAKVQPPAEGEPIAVGIRAGGVVPMRK